MTYQFMLFPNFREKAVTLSYDDGARHDIRLIDIMSKYGLKGTFNLCSGLLKDDDRIHANELKGLYLDTGNEIAVHGCKHISLPSVSDDRIINEIFTDRKIWEELTGQIVTGMAYANGKYDDRVVDVLKKCGISYARTTVCTGDFKICDDWLRLTGTCHHNNAKLFDLVAQFLSEEKDWYFWSNHPKLFFLWGHSHEFGREGNWNRIEEFAKAVGGREDVWYATNGEIVNYVKAYNRLIYSADGSMVYNPSAIDVYIKTEGEKKLIVPSGKSVRV